MNAELFTSTGAALAAPSEPAELWHSGARYGWRIDTDFIADPNDPDDAGEDVGTVGPRNISKRSITALANGEGVPFRMYDDDGTLYYAGRLIGDPDSLHGFAPLDDFGMPNAGCTRIEYRNAAGQWETL